MARPAMMAMGIDPERGGEPSLSLDYNGTFTAHSFPGKIIHKGGRDTGEFNGSGHWWMSKLGGFQTVALNFETVENGAPAVPQLMVDSENGRPYLFDWQDEEGSNRLTFERSR
jgi:hypothetical protein